MEVSILKCHGSLNDFVLIDTSEQIRRRRIRITERDVRSLCDRSGPVGADGVLLLDRPSGHHPVLRVFNADGGEAEISGNGLRCAGRYLCDRLHSDNCDVMVHGRLMQVIRVDDLAGGVPGICAVVEGVRVCGTILVTIPSASADDARGGSRQVAGVSVEAPNPHIVILGEEAGAIPPTQLGRCRLPDGSQATERYNVSLAVRLDAAAYHLTTFERGAGRTLSCGSAACSLAAFLLRGHRSSQGVDLSVHSDGGMLRCRAESAGPSTEVSVRLTGNATYVWSARIKLSDGAVSVAEESRRVYAKETHAYGHFLSALRDRLWTDHRISSWPARDTA